MAGCGPTATTIRCSRCLTFHFWVYWILKQLFSIDALSGRLLFKGGISLSKIFHAISRFSEDIDLALTTSARAAMSSSRS